MFIELVGYTKPIVSIEMSFLVGTFEIRNSKQIYYRQRDKSKIEIVCENLVT